MGPHILFLHLIFTGLTLYRAKKKTQLQAVSQSPMSEFPLLSCPRTLYVGKYTEVLAPYTASQIHRGSQQKQCPSK